MEGDMSKAMASNYFRFADCIGFGIVDSNGKSS